MNKAEFWATKSPLPQYHAITFAHTAFTAPIRLVANVFAPVTLGGNVHTPAAMKIQEPVIGPDGQQKMTVAFPRQFVGRQFKQQLAAIVAAGSRDPITVTHEIYTGDTATPTVSVALYVSDAAGIAFDAETVQVTATRDNPMNRAVSLIYTVEAFSGLQGL